MNSLHREMSIWTNTRFSEPALKLLREGASKHRLIEAHTLSSTESNQTLREADIAFGQPDVSALMSSTQLTWAHISSAGYTSYDRDDFKLFLRERGALLTNSSSVFDEPCAQHLLSMMLADARQLLPSYASQLGDHSWNGQERREGSILLGGQNVLILGYGAIARRLIELLAPFDLRITALRRHKSGDETCEIIGENELESALKEADYVVNILPDNASTRGWMNAQRFEQMKRGARFFNIGRGATVDQNTLLGALESGALALAYLDVCDPEPLPPDHPLWSAPRCFLTPHTAGGHRGEEERLVRHFLRNLRALETGEALKDQVV